MIKKISFILIIFAMLGLFACENNTTETEPPESGVIPEGEVLTSVSDPVEEMPPLDMADVDFDMSSMFSLIEVAQYGDMDMLQQMIDDGAEVDETDEQGITALMSASLLGLNEVCSLLLENGADPNLESPDGFTPIMYAAGRGNMELYQILLAAGAEVDKNAADNTTSIMSAAMGGDFDIYQDMVDKGLDRTTLNQSGANALLYAAMGGNFEIYEDLKDIEEDPNFTDQSGFTLLLGACMNGNPEIVEDLIDRGADVNVQFGEGLTPLRFAIRYNHPEAIQLLLDAGADPNEFDGQQEPLLTFTTDPATASTMSAQFNSQLISSMLIDAGAEIDFENDRGFTPLMFAAIADKHAMVTQLLNDGADVNAINDKGNSVVMFAILSMNADLVQDIVDAGADLSAKNMIGYNALLNSASLFMEGENSEEYMEKFTRIAEVIIPNAPDINVTTNDGMTALSLAAYTGNYETFKLLLDAGADPNRVGLEADTPLNAALMASSDRTQIILDLLDAGADPNVVSPVAQNASLWISMSSPIHGNDVVAALVEAGSDILAMDSNGMNPFLWALTIYDDIELVKIFLDAGVDPNYEKDGVTALNMIVENDEMKELLISYGATE